MERRLWEQAERERQAHLTAQDLEQAQAAVDHLRSIRPGLLQGSMTSLAHPQTDGHSLAVWRTEPQVSPDLLVCFVDGGVEGPSSALMAH